MPLVCDAANRRFGPAALLVGASLAARRGIQDRVEVVPHELQGLQRGVRQRLAIGQAHIGAVLELEQGGDTVAVNSRAATFSGEERLTCPSIMCISSSPGSMVRKAFASVVNRASIV